MAAKSKNYDEFVKAYNNFDSRPLSGEKLQKFYIDDFASQSVEEIITTIRISERFRKMLVIGHRGCGKSTILNKIADELKNEYHVVAFSAGDVINMMDVETVDILLATYLQVLESVKLSKDIFDKLFDKFNDFYKLFNKKITLEETGVELLGTLSFKFKVEPDSREVIRKALFDQIKHLQENLSRACQQIQERQNKEILIIIDDLDKLPPQLAERIFFENFFMLTLPDVKIIYTFPLDTYYDEAFISVTDKYEVMFIPVVNLSVFQPSLEKLILRRIQKELIEKKALEYISLMSGGLLRDLVKFMQDACKTAIVRHADIIDKDIAETVITDYVNDYYRIFDFSMYADKVKTIASTKKKSDNESLIYLLRHLFVLEYRHEKNLWYDTHPCLKKAIEFENHGKTCTP